MNEPLMTERSLAELKVCVERAVRPVRASQVRKRRMRDDLLSHLLAIYDDEFARTGDDERALREAKRRFGVPSETAEELARSIPRWDAVRSVLDMARLEPHESLGHLVVKHLLLISGAYAVAFLLGAVVRSVWLGPSQLLLMAQVTIVMAIFTTGFSSAFVFLADRMGRALYGQEHERSKRAGAKYCALAALILPVMMTLVYAGLGSAPTLASLVLTGVCAPLIPLLLVLLARQAAEEASYEAEWAALSLDA